MKTSCSRYARAVYAAKRVSAWGWGPTRSKKCWLVARIMTAVGTVFLLPAMARAQRQPAPPASTARSSAPIDLTGYWVSVVTEDWLYRMVTPGKGDYASVPLNPEGRKVADTWDAAKDEAAGNQCKAYGAAAIMRVPGRLHITWQDDSTLKVETDSGMQVRSFHFGPAGGPGGDWQGVSAAAWEVVAGARGPIPGAGLRVMTTKMKPGYLRKNGVPYGGNAQLTEYYDRVTEANGDSWLIVKTIVDDPAYLTVPFVTSTHFKKQVDSSGWTPRPCLAR
jgi:hypothetical protein